MKGSTRNPAVALARSADGTAIRYRTLGVGADLVVLGGVLSSGDEYLRLAAELACDFRVHVVDRRGRPGSGPQLPAHSIADECADLSAVLEETGATRVFGHSFGGLVVLETARAKPAIEQLVVYEPGVPLRGLLTTTWFAAYERRLQAGDRRGAFAAMVKQSGFAPSALTRMPLALVRGVLRVGIRGDEWAAMDELLEANLNEHRAQAALEATDASRFSTVTAGTLLLAGAKSPPAMHDIVTELAAWIPGAETKTVPGLDHRAPEHEPQPVAAEICTYLT